MQHSVTSNATSSSVSSVKSSALVQIFGAIVLGFALLYGVGFANMDVAHNAAHDTRHAIAFPCH
jgi:cobalt transporter subunit CbtB